VESKKRVRKKKGVHLVGIADLLEFFRVSALVRVVLERRLLVRLRPSSTVNRTYPNYSRVAAYPILS
jgi:hypothetical protein